MLKPDHLLVLEALFDQNSVKTVLEAMADIAGQKAEHPQDGPSAECWNAISEEIFSCASTVEFMIEDPGFQTGGEQDD